ncbi:MAG: hypothetical protein JSR58_03465 [Verrucomicrobia bacterium]|nr:hypothetical protein [Verrucomicrobiota bacterium]
MRLLMLLPYLVQMLAIGLDEFIFHVRRGLPKWERIGHPLDTLSVLACFLFVLCVPYSPLALKIYIGLAIFSCILVTKDEFVHKHVCPASEQWLHAVLFVNHSIVLIVTGILWPSLEGAFYAFLGAQAGFVFLFFLYQVIYWNFIRENQQ